MHGSLSSLFFSCKLRGELLLVSLLCLPFELGFLGAPCLNCGLLCCHLVLLLQALRPLTLVQERGQDFLGLGIAGQLDAAGEAAVISQQRLDGVGLEASSEPT